MHVIAFQSINFNEFKIRYNTERLYLYSSECFPQCGVDLRFSRLTIQGTEQC